MARVVLYDANALYGVLQRDLLVRAGIVGFVQAKWTDKILDETFESIIGNRPDLDPVALRRTRELMNCAIRDCLVQGYEWRIQDLDLPDPDDRHVLAAAIHCEARVIVTRNLGDFPDAALAPFEMVARSPDDFLAGLVEEDPARMWQVITDIAVTVFGSPSGDEMLARLKKNGLVKTASGLAVYS